MSNHLLSKRELRLFKGLFLLFLLNVPGAMFIQGGTFIPDSRVLMRYKRFSLGDLCVGDLSVGDPSFEDLSMEEPSVGDLLSVAWRPIHGNPICGRPLHGPPIHEEKVCGRPVTRETKLWETCR